MARPLRLEYEGAVYHVMSRGHERRSLFLDDQDRELFLDELRRVVEEKRWLAHGYCLMSNHYHLLLETPVPNLTVGMQALNARFSQAFNRRHGRTGHVLEGRYQSILVEKDAYLLELGRYIVLNPVKARMVKSPGDFRWSNYAATAGEIPRPSWLETDWTLAQFGRSVAAARTAYRRFVAEGKGRSSPLQAISAQVYLGGEGFLSDVAARLKDADQKDAFAKARLAASFVPIDDVKAAVAREFGVETSRLTRKRGGADKVAGIYLARRLSGLRSVEIGKAFGVTPARVSNVVRDVETGRWAELKGRIQELEKGLRG